MLSILKRSFNYKGFNCYVIFREICGKVYRCGYVQIPKNIAIDTTSIDCHGGITYAYKEPPSPLEVNDENKWYIGFDCAHAFDTADFWDSNRVSEELRHIVEQIIETNKESEE